MAKQAISFDIFAGWIKAQARDLQDALSSVGLSGNLYIVGGTIRDALIGREPRDGDFAGSFDYRSMLALFAVDTRFNVEQSNSILMTLGMLHVPTGTHIDMAVLRAERYGDESLYPVEVSIQVPIEWDLARRDFTVNAMAYDIEAHELIDPYEGRADIASKYIRVLHEDSFKDDPKRIIRAVELATRLGFTLEKTTAELAEHCVMSASFDKLESAIQKQELIRLIKENS